MHKVVFGGAIKTGGPKVDAKRLKKKPGELQAEQREEMKEYYRMENKKMSFINNSKSRIILLI